MQTNTSFGQFEDLFIMFPVPIVHIAYRVRELIETIYPKATETPKPKENHAEYAIGSGRRSEIFGYICPMEKYVRLGFYYGDVLADPAGVLVEEGKRVRHVKISTMAEADRPEIRALITAAVQERKKTLGIG